MSSSANDADKALDFSPLYICDESFPIETLGLERLSVVIQI